MDRSRNLVGLLGNNQTKTRMKRRATVQILSSLSRDSNSCNDEKRNDSPLDAFSRGCGRTGRRHPANDVL